MQRERLNEITIKGFEEAKGTIRTQDIPIGFFMGKIGGYPEGLFFRSKYDITMLQLGEKGEFYNWGYLMGPGADGCLVDKYIPVRVTIQIEQ